MSLACLFTELKRTKLEYAVLRNYSSLPASTGGSDLDVLVSPTSMDHFLEIVRRVFNDDRGLVIGEAESLGFVKLCGFGLVENTTSWWGVCIDVFPGIYYYGSIQLVDCEFILRNVQFHGEVAIVPSRLAGLIGVLKEVLNNSKLPSRYIGEARAAFRDDEQLVFSALAPMGHRAINLLRTICFQEESDPTLSKACKKLRACLRTTSITHRPLDYLCRTFAYKAKRAFRFIRPPGVMIAILGTDGAGKSTIINSIVPLLEESTHGTLFQHHLRPGLLPALGSIFGQNNQPTTVTNPHGSPPSGFLVSSCRLGWLLLDYTLGYWMIVRPRIARTPSVVLFDRYAPDMLIDPRRFRVSLPSWILKAAVWLVRRPDAIVCLYGDPEIIVNRKNELSLTEIRRQTLELKSFAMKNNRAILVSTDTSIEETRTATLNAIVELVRQKKGTR